MKNCDMTEEGIHNSANFFLSILEKTAQQTRNKLPTETRPEFERLYKEVVDTTRNDIHLALALSTSEHLPSEQEHLPVKHEFSEHEISLTHGRPLHFRARGDLERPIPANPFVSVFLPIRNGREHVLASLLGLQDELRSLRENGIENELHICLNASDDGTRDHLLRHQNFFEEIPITFYEVDVQELRSSGKIDALQMLFTLLSRRRGFTDNKTLYVHIADDDIGYPKQKNGILQNIATLRSHPNLRATSGTYTYKKKTIGFPFLNSLRRVPDIIAPLHPFPTLYGGALTLRAQDFPMEKLPEKTSFDVYLVLRELRNRFREGVLPELLLEEPDNLPVRTNPEFFAEHEEESCFHTFVWRLLRDCEWREHAAEALGDPTVSAVFLCLRKAYFNAVTERIASLSPEDPRRIGQEWMRAIRDHIYELRSSIDLRSKDFGKMATVRRFPSAHAWCAGLVNDPERLAQLASLLHKHDVLTVQDQEQLASPLLSEKQRFKCLEHSTRINHDRIGDPSGAGSAPDITILKEYIRRVDATRSALSTPKIVRELLKHGELPHGVDLQIEQVMGGRMNLAYRISSGGHRYFMKYFDPMGTEFFQRREPRGAVFCSLLAEQVYAEILGKKHVAGSQYPNIDIAISNAFGPEEISPVEQIKQRTILQPDLSESHMTLEEAGEQGMTEEEKAERFARVIAELHGRSLGIAHAQINGTCNTRLLRLLSIGQQDIRSASHQEFALWLKEKNWITQTLLKLIQTPDASNPVYSLVRDTLRHEGIEIQSLLADMIDRSEKRHESSACIGHFDLSPPNVFLRRDNLDVYTIIDIDRLGFVDPVYEAGHGIYSLLWHRIRTDRSVSSEELFATAQRFVDTYLSTLTSTQSSNTFSSTVPPLDQDEFRRDMEAFGGMTLLRVAAEDYKKEHLSFDQMTITRELVTEFVRQAAR